MAFFAILLGVISAFAGLFYFVLGRNRYGEGGRPNRLQIAASSDAAERGSVRSEPCRTVRVYFIKPSRYDEEGYVQFYRWGVLPMNTLTVLAALNESFNKRYSIERNVYLETVIWDELCDGPITPETIRAIKEK